MAKKSGNEMTVRRSICRPRAASGRRRSPFQARKPALAESGTSSEGAQQANRRTRFEANDRHQSTTLADAEELQR
jgi:hypothetical protein